MTRSARVLRFLRWHGARMRDGEYQFVRLPVGRHPREIISISKDGEELYIYPPFMERVLVRLPHA